jgi:hypothetical protein
MSAAASSSSSSVAGVTKKRSAPEPSAAEVAQSSLLDEIFSVSNHAVIARALAAPRVQPHHPMKKVKTDSGKAADAFMEPEEKPAFNPFVHAMDQSAKVKQVIARPGPSARTANGAASLATTKAPCLDLFYHLARGYSKEAIESALPICWNENPETTLQVLLHARDCHSVKGKGGKGERLVVYYALIWLRINRPRSYLANLITFLRVG